MLVLGPCEGLWSECVGPIVSAQGRTGECASAGTVAVLWLWDQSMPCGALKSEQSQLSSSMPKARSDSETGGNPGRFH